MLAADRARGRPARVSGVPVFVSGATMLQVRDVQVRARMALRQLAAHGLVSGPGAASRRNARVILFLA